ncbi:hypothetical protein GGTG_04336 [Gaeumannomyces tritici R3-111a-1]|uniref:Uncharacterized protein n=1 Tax=Gaeumannomyces tritici (strain R3-111a-1) TaxID=644352 RepID=J3NST7_GAET3|nr:hypothetical protein GGTG_04336 [Gaeumannomyces tritici R3-111a-1]EJT79250.1 hypothetical protein GGTG_04336 [Gaeumannomyces tritici R3-111a-1]
MAVLIQALLSALSRTIAGATRGAPRVAPVHVVTGVFGDHDPPFLEYWPV